MNSTGGVHYRRDEQEKQRLVGTKGLTMWPLPVLCRLQSGHLEDSHGQCQYLQMTCHRALCRKPLRWHLLRTRSPSSCVHLSRGTSRREQSRKCQNFWLSFKLKGGGRKCSQFFVRPLLVAEPLLGTWVVLVCHCQVEASYQENLASQTRIKANAEKTEPR